MFCLKGLSTCATADHEVEAAKHGEIICADEDGVEGLSPIKRNADGVAHEQRFGKGYCRSWFPYDSLS